VANARGKVTIVSEVSDELRDATDERAAAEGRSRSELIEADAVPAPVAGSPRKGAVR
jgi:hypothetical protein